MRRALIASGVLGLGTALVFGAAALTATLFPGGTTIPGTMNGWGRNGVFVMDDAMGRPIPMPVMAEPPVMVNSGGGIQIDVAPDEDGEPALP